MAKRMAVSADASATISSTKLSSVSFKKAFTAFDYSCQPPAQRCCCSKALTRISGSTEMSR
jgi:hypothetical protein